jgi:hypothetical protein
MTHSSNCHVETELCLNRDARSPEGYHSDDMTPPTLISQPGIE